MGLPYLYLYLYLYLNYAVWTVFRLFTATDDIETSSDERQYYLLFKLSSSTWTPSIELYKRNIFFPWFLMSVTCPDIFRFFLALDSTGVLASFFMFLDHTQRRTTVGRTSLDMWSARRRDLYLTTHNTHNRQTSMPQVRFEPKVSAGKRPQTYALYRAATGTGDIFS